MARAGPRADAHTLLDEASEAARRIGTERSSRGATWGPIHAGLFAVGAHRALGDAGTAVDLSRRIRLQRSRVAAERQVRLLTDTARAHNQAGHVEETLRTLQLMVRTAPEDAARPSNQRITRDLLFTAPRRLQSSARELAVRTGAI